MHRDIIEVILTLIDFCEDIELERCLSSLKDSCFYASPETVASKWGSLGTIISDNMPGYDDLTPWQRDMVDYYRGEYGSGEA